MTQTDVTETKRRTTPAQWWALGLASSASFLVILDMLVVATSLTGIRRSLGASLEQLEWTINAYTLSFAVLLMTAAALGDRFGRRRMFMGGLAVFAVSSVACALAPNTWTLIAARVVQGIGAATIMPMALALLNATFPPQRRGWAIGVYGSVTGFAALVGPILGGAVTQGLGWQWIFWLNVPIAAAAIPLVRLRVEEGFGPAGRIDLPGLLLVSAAALGLVWGLVRANEAGWDGAETITALVVGTVAAACFVTWQRRAELPMLPVRMFGSRAFSAGNAAIFFLNASMTGAVFLMPQFQQVAVGHGPLGAGLRLLPWGIAPFLIAPRAGALADRIGERLLVIIGLLCLAVGMAWIALIAAPGLGYLALVAPMSLVGVGFALAIPAVTRAVIANVPRADIGKASGAFSTMRQLGGAFGVAILAAVFAAAGGYASPQAFSDGFAAAFAVGAIIAIAGALAGGALPGRETPAVAASASPPGQGRPGSAPANSAAAIDRPRPGRARGGDHDAREAGT